MAKLGPDEQESDTRPAQWGNPVQNIPAISGILGSRGILFHCDAAQAPCAMDMGKLAAHADLVSLSGHKMYGPSGFVYSLEVWPESHWPGFALRQADVIQSYTAW